LFPPGGVPRCGTPFNANVGKWFPSLFLDPAWMSPRGGEAIIGDERIQSFAQPSEIRGLFIDEFG
jgi:hypothetical protein